MIIVAISSANTVGIKIQLASIQDSVGKVAQTGRVLFSEQYQQSAINNANGTHTNNTHHAMNTFLLMNIHLHFFVTVASIVTLISGTLTSEFMLTVLCLMNFKN
jgi:hypothetical protein